MLDKGFDPDYQDYGAHSFKSSQDDSASFLRTQMHLSDTRDGTSIVPVRDSGYRPPLGPLRVFVTR
jgi:hypothetical protein